VNDDPLADGAVARKLAEIGSPRPAEVFRIENRRRGFLESGWDGESIELASDRATITGPDGVGGQRCAGEPIEEVELELREGSAEFLRALAEGLRERVGLRSSRLSKFERVLKAIGMSPMQWRRPVGGIDEETARALTPGDRRFKPRDSALAYAASYLGACFASVLAEEGQAWDGEDPEGVHRMRIGLRRMRVALRAFHSVLPEVTGATLKNELKWIAGVLGEVRDLDVLRAWAEVEEDDAEGQREEHDGWSLVRQRLAEDWEAARWSLAEALASEFPPHRPW
jgi:inorganic triphosphatase YgiF